MKNIFLLIAIMILFPMIGKAGTLLKVPVNIYHTYIPAGFDSNDQSEVFISGSLPNTCYKNPFAEIIKTEHGFDIKMMAYYQNSSDSKCVKMLIPFTKKIDLGLLDKGQYSISVFSGMEILKVKKLKVAESVGQAVDDFVYASVDYIEESPYSRAVQLRGYNPSDCYQFERVEIVSNHEDTYSILPIMKKVSDFCPGKRVPFSIEVLIPNEIQKNNVLLHVRSMDGRSINHLFAKHRQ